MAESRFKITEMGKKGMRRYRNEIPVQERRTAEVGKDDGQTHVERCDDQQRKLSACSRSKDEDEGLNPQITTYMIRIGQSDVFTAFCASFIVAGREKHLGERFECTERCARGGS